MGCSGCSTASKSGTPKGCRSNGHCQSGGCNKLNTFDWLNALNIEDPVDSFDVVEVSFKNGNRKSFYKNNIGYTNAQTGDLVVVEADTGYDVGRISLSGELVRLQMKKKRFSPKKEIKKVSRLASSKDIQKLEEARRMEQKTLIRSRELVRMLELDMKIGEVEFQGDKRKATFYYIADGRVDFRELIRHYAQEFRIKVEMRQIGARQESGLIGGVGSCGRELCCSTWLTNFKSVTTTAARYQNLAINQSKLSGQCGRLKCCLNFELDTYMDALQDFPKRADKLRAESGTASLLKKDIFKRIMYYVLPQEAGRNKILALPVERVKEIQELNKKGEKPPTFEVKRGYGAQSYGPNDEVEIDFDFEDVNNVLELPPEKKKKYRRNKKRNPRKTGSGNNTRNSAGKGKPKKKEDKQGGNQGSNKSKNSSSNKPRRKHPPRNKKNNPRNPNSKSD